MNGSIEQIAIIGAGKVGTAMAYLLQKAGYGVAAVSDRNPSALVDILSYTSAQPCSSPEEAARKADFILITTPDDEIAGTCRTLSDSGAILPGNKVVHMSGAGGLDLLESARRSGALVASIHPIQSFADIGELLRTLPGSAFGVTAQEELVGWAEKLVRDLGGKPFLVREADKPLYHAAACMASNYLTTLLHTVETIYASFGLTREQSIEAFWPLVLGTIRNIERQGTVSALTGPIARGDTGTVQKHLDAFYLKLPHFLRIYQEMGVLTVELGVEKGSLSTERAEALKNLLRGVDTDQM